MKFVSNISEAARIELFAELTELRNERRARAWDGFHTYDDLRFISGWIQALEWVLGEEYSDEPSAETHEEASHWHWRKVQDELITKGIFTPSEEDAKWSEEFDRKFVETYGHTPQFPEVTE